MAALLSVVSTTAWALSEVNGFYQIGTAADFAAFTQLVNGGTRDANAILTADIDLGAITTQIGTGGSYLGLFDGAGHTLTINLPDRSDGEGPALFRNLGNRGIIQNLKVQGAITTGTSKHTAAIVNYTTGLIRNCYVDVVVTSSFTDDKDASIGGLAGQLNRPAIIENCLAKVKITGATTHKCGGLAAWVDEHHVTLANNLVINDVESNFNWTDGKSAGLARVDSDNPLKTVDLTTYNTNSYSNRPTAANANNYVTNNWGVDNVGTTVVTSDELASGKVCFQLNSDQSHISWVQNLGTDPFPVPAPFGTGRVYASAATNCQGKAEGALTFSNSGSDTATKHTYDKYGVCTTCGQFNFNCFEFDDPTRFEPATKTVLLGSADDLYLAEGWSRLQNGFKLNMKMVNDITCTPPTGQLIFNNNDWIDGNFNGDGHTLTITIADIQEVRASFMPEHCGIFENVIMHGTIGTSKTNAGCISGEGRQSLVRNVYSDVTITSTINGDNSSGGFFGKMIYAKTVENCVYAGDFITPRTDLTSGCVRIGGFAGWSNDAVTFKNCAFLGHLVGAGCANDTQTAGTENSYNISRNPSKITCENVYVANPITSKYVKDDEISKNFFTTITADGIANGELAFLLNGSEGGVERFYQVIDTDPIPMPIAKEGGLVYAVASEYRCDGLPLGDEITYSNTASGTIPAHTYVDGWCTVCNGMQEDYMSPVDGYFEIGTRGQLAWWANYACTHPTAKARLTADIDMKVDDTNNYSKHYVPVGTATNLYTGEFDGQGHTISNLIISGGNYTGMFGYIGNGADIKNFVLGSTCSISGNAFVGLIGGTSGSGKVYITNVGNEGTVTSTAQNAAGIVGCDTSGAADMFITNCYVTGAVNGNRESATICGWSSSASVIENCYSTATLTGIYSTGSFTRGNAAVVNSYEIEGVGQQAGVNKTTTAEVASGALCFKLNGQQNGVERFYQKLGEGGDAMPKPFAKEGALVYAIASDGYRCDGQLLGDVTYTNIETTPVISDHHFDTNGICTVCGDLEKDADGYMKIINAQTLTAFTTIVNINGKKESNARMYADVDMTGITDYYPIGCEEYVYTGEFDGQGHVVKNLVINNGGYNYQGMFGRIGHGADIKNFILDNTCSINGASYCGIIGGTNGGGTIHITNVGNEGTVTGGGANVSGIIGVDMGGSIDMHITNCYVTGAISGNRESATICSWSSANSKVTNCWSTATLSGIYGTNSFTRGNTAVVNCYEISTEGQQSGVNKVTATEVTSGALCYKVNESTDDGTAWTQTIGTDAHPVLFGTSQTVHRASASSYTNLPVVDGKVQIATAANLKKFADEVNAGNATTPAVLTADIDYTAYPKGFIGTESKKYAGTFDGQKYTVTTDIKNDAKATGLFGSIIDATIRNLVIDGNIESSQKWIGGIGGISRGDNTLIENVVVKSAIKFTGTDDSTCGGLFGDMEGAFTVKNCAFVGSINVGEGLNVGGLVSWTGSGTFTNCLVAPVEVIAGSQKDFIHGGAGTCNNCYKVESTDTKLASGELCYMLNGSTQGGTDWYQNLTGSDVDAYPVPFSTHSTVSQIAVTDAGYATFVPKANVAALPAGVTAYAAQKNPTWVHLEEVTEIPADNAVVVKAAEGAYYYNNTTEARTLGVDNDLTFSNDAVVTDGTQYILAKVDDVVGFYKATGTIPAGKGYLVINDNLVKGFYGFAADDETGIANVEKTVENDAIYNLAGQRISKTQKGINIINGKKVLF